MTRTLLALAFALPLLRSIHASPLPPIIQATSSPNGTCLVLISHTPPANLSPGPTPILATTFQLIRPALLNPNHRVAAPIKLWADSSWTLTLPRGYDLWPMVTDDCNTLVLLHTQAAAPHQPAFDIYRRERNTAVPVASISLDSLWTPRELDPSGKGLVVISDASPFWFSSGFLAFTADCQSLTYRTPRNDHLRISLTTGAVVRLDATR